MEGALLTGPADGSFAGPQDADISTKIRKHICLIIRFIPAAAFTVLSTFIGLDKMVFSFSFVHNCSTNVY